MSKNLKNGKANFWAEYNRLNGSYYGDKYTKAHKKLKSMYKYNYNDEWQDETDLRTPSKYRRNIDLFYPEDMEEEENA
jgi:hypothetical protein